MEWIKIIVPSVIPLIGVLIGIGALWWKITTSVATRAEMNRADDKLQEQINLVAVSIQAVMKELREDIRQLRSDILKLDEKMDTGFTRLNEKIDANSQAHHTDIMQVIDKIDGVANDLRAEMRERASGKTDDIDS